MKRQEERGVYVPKLFEFVFYRNNEEDGMICTREFTLNNFNPDAVQSYAVKEMIDEIVGVNTPSGAIGIIPKVLKEETKKYLWGHYGWRYYAGLDDVGKEVNRYEADLNENEKEYFFFEVRKVNIKLFNGYPKREKSSKFIREEDAETTLIGSGMFDGNAYPRKVRHFVDIRRHYSEIIDTIAEHLTSEKPVMVNG